MRKYKSPLVSCIHCRITTSSSGIFSHFFSKHDAAGSEIMKKIRKRGTAASFNNSDWQKKYNANHSQKQINKCVECGSDTVNPKFCSRSCSCKVSNRNRTQESYDKQRASLAKTNSIKLATKPPNQQKIKSIKTRQCIKCGKIDITSGHFQSDLCNFCNPSLTYRLSCNFTFDIRKYPDEFDIDLLIKHGMFHPVKNKTGVSKDHMLTISYGKTNHIDPKIMSHPANCKLMLQTENHKKHITNSLTLRELMIKISEWDAKYKDAGGEHDSPAASL